MEHNPWDIRALRDCLQYMLNRGQIAKSGSVAPAVTPMVRIPAERRREGAVARQAGARPRLLTASSGRTSRTVEEAYNAVAACRYPRLKDKPLLRAAGHPRRRADRRGALLGPDPAGILRAADVWPLNPEGRDLRHPA